MVFREPPCGSWYSHLTKRHYFDIFMMLMGNWTFILLFPSTIKCIYCMIVRTLFLFSLSHTQLNTFFGLCLLNVEKLLFRNCQHHHLFLGCLDSKGIAQLPYLFGVMRETSVIQWAQPSSRLHRGAFCAFPSPPHWNEEM